MKNTGHYLFHEEQSFRSSPFIFLIGIIFVGTLIIQAGGMYRQLYLHKPFGDNPMSDTGLIITSVGVILLMLLVLFLFLYLKLITEVRNDGFYYRFPILINKQKFIPKEDISRFEVGKYNPIGEFGGWGIRIRPGKRKAYNVTGNQGVKFFLKNGKMVLFGTQQTEELRRALDKMMNPSNL
jgi:hypothetical protein